MLFEVWITTLINPGQWVVSTLIAGLFVMFLKENYTPFGESVSKRWITFVSLSVLGPVTSTLLVFTLVVGLLYMSITEFVRYMWMNK